MFINLELAYWVLYGVLGLMGIFTIAIMTVKFRAANDKKKTAKSRQKLQSYLDYVQNQLSKVGPISIPDMTLAKYDKKVLQEVLCTWIERYEGESRQKLITLCEELGLVEFNLKRMKSPSHFKKLDAAYYLGGMRNSRAVPALFTLLENTKDDSELFIIGRSIAQTTNRPEDIKSMLMHVAKGEKNNYLLLADIVNESTLNLQQQFEDLISSNNADLVNVSLLSLAEDNDYGMDSRAKSLLRSKHRDIRVNAARLILASGQWSAEDIKQLIQFKDVEMRVFVANWIGEKQLAQLTHLLREGVQDTNQRVARTCAKSLLQLGDIGFTQLCEIAKQEDGQTASIALECLEEDIKVASANMENLEKVNMYNHKVYLFEKYFGKNNDLIQAI
ncbi:hypothetical protein ACFFGV_16240 [Pontibacillus salicampi]|uniref:HEAT repeat domain-containing protein n=1 Tax=Pontibacillus salicampi TaxID=1449801 RepID=A0ABV6LRT6_9BACI